MGKYKVRIALAILFSVLILQPGIPAFAATQARYQEQEKIIQQVDALLPQAVQMVDTAIEVLSIGWSEMSPAEREQFLGYYDPGKTGEVDDDYVQAVLNNYQKIREKLIRDLTIAYAPNSNRCKLMTLYYTDFFRVHVCPYILSETSHQRIARDLVHEVAHMAWLAFDRSYYYPHFSEYASLTPNVHWSAHIPIVGLLLREILRRDTLYNPDTYAKYAAELANPTQGMSQQLKANYENVPSSSELLKNNVATYLADLKLLSISQEIEPTTEIIPVDRKLLKSVSKN